MRVFLPFTFALIRWENVAQVWSDCSEPTIPLRKNAPVLANHPPRLLVSPPRFSAYSDGKDRFSKGLLALGFRSGATRCSLTNSSG
jgi:hypothetical protein